MRSRIWLAAVIVLTMAVGGIPAVADTPGDTTGVVDQTTGIWYLRDASNGATTSFYYGNPGDYPMVGDWNCDNIDTPGLYRQSDGYVYLRNSNTQGNADIRFFFGNPGDIPLPGDFNKDGCDTVSIYRPSEARIYVINKLGSNDGGLGAADYDFYFGNPGDKPFTGDFNNNGQDTVGLHRESTGFVYYRNTLTTGIADNDFFYGDPGDQIITGRWAQDPTKGSDTVGIFRPSNARFYLRFENSQGNANVDYPYGNSNMAAVAGDFGVLPGGDPAPPGTPTTPPPTTTTTTTTLPPADFTMWNCDFSGSVDYDLWCYGDTDPITTGEESWLCNQGVTWACAGDIDQVDTRVDAWGCSTTSASTYACFGDIDNRTSSDETWSCVLGSNYWSCNGNIDTSDVANESWTCQAGSSPDWLCLGDVDKAFPGAEAFACDLGGPVGRAWECYGDQSWLAPVVSNPDFLLSDTLVGSSAFESHQLSTAGAPQVRYDATLHPFVEEFLEELLDAHLKASENTQE